MHQIVRITCLAVERTAQKMRTEIPPEIPTPDLVETSLGTSKFSDGLPDKATVEGL